MRDLINLVEALERGCPPATQDIDLNLKNRKKAIDEYDYGPMDPNAPNEEYWQRMAREWNMSDPEQAKSARCGNCAAFDVSESMQDCIAKGIGSEPGSDPTATINAGTLGYCKFLKFKCAAKRTCTAWVEGGPVTEQQETCPHCGGPITEDPMLAEKQDACYRKVKSRYKVWPSAYASGALVQCRKRGAANWGNKS